MNIEDIDAQLEALEKQRAELTAKMQDLHSQRGQIMDEEHAKAILDGLTPSQRDVVIKAAALHTSVNLPDAK